MKKQDFTVTLNLTVTTPMGIAAEELSEELDGIRLIDTLAIDALVTMVDEVKGGTIL